MLRTLLGRLVKLARADGSRVAVALAAAVFGATLSSPCFADPKVEKIYLGVGTTSSEYWSEFIWGATQVANSVGVKVDVLTSEFQGQKLLQQFGAIFAAGCEHCPVILDPASNAFTKAIVERADKADARIITLWNRPDEIHPWNTFPKSWVAHASFDGVDSGYQNGKALCRAIGGKGGVAALQGIPDNPPAKQRLAGLRKALAEPECKGVKLLDVQVGNWDQTQGQNITRTWIARFGKDLSGIFAANDGMAIGAVAALRESGLAGKIQVTGSDGGKDAIKMIKSGDMLSSMYIDGVTQGATAAALAYASATGDIDPNKLTHVQRDFYLSQTLITKDNADQFLEHTRNPQDFTYQRLKANFWAFSRGQIPEGANK